MFISNILEFLSRIFFFSSYVSVKASYPKPLVSEEETYYLNLYKTQKDANAREMLIKHNLRLVAHVSKKYNSSMDSDDLISIGSIGLVKGIESYQNDKGTALATYLARCIENEILMALRTAKRSKGVVSLNDPLGVDNEGNEFALIDVLSIKEDSVFKKVESEILSQKLKKILLGVLSKREYAILEMRFGLNGKQSNTQLETATKLGISRSYVSRIEKKALSKVREKLKRNDYIFD